MRKYPDTYLPLGMYPIKESQPKKIVPEIVENLDSNPSLQEYENDDGKYKSFTHYFEKRRSIAEEKTITLGPEADFLGDRESSLMGITGMHQKAEPELFPNQNNPEFNISQ